MERPRNLYGHEEPSASKHVPKSTSISQERFSLPYLTRVSTVATGGLLVGMALGLTHGIKTTNLRFRAENSHRFPSTPQGWYLYHKSKNYHLILGGVKEGLKMGPKLAFWTGGLFVLEEALDRMRGTKDFVSTVVAGLGVAGVFSAWSELWMPHFSSTFHFLMLIEYGRSISCTYCCANC